MQYLSKRTISKIIYIFSPADAVLFHANIWLYIYGLQGSLNNRLKTIYGKALREIRSVKGRIFLDVLVLSEFINAYARFAYNELPETTKKAIFKNFSLGAMILSLWPKGLQNIRGGY